LKEKAIICLSKGNPPMPAQDPSIVCGPQVVGTQRPANWDDIAKLNPCPLNVSKALYKL
jgi:chitinase